MPPRHLDLNLLRAFDALMQERNVTRAAMRLSLTQPAVSGMLTRLRDTFHDPLFVRSQGGISPTPRAEQLIEPVRQLLADADRLMQPAEFDPASAQLTVTVAATDYALRAVVQPFIVGLRKLAPGVRVAVHAIDEARVQERMERGALDFALLTPGSAPADLHARALFDEHYVAVMREHHPLSSDAAWSLEAFCAADHGMVSLEGGGFTGATDAALAGLGRTRRVVASVPSFLMLLDLVRHSDMIALVPARLVATGTGLVSRPPPLAVPGFTKLLTWHPRTHDDPAHRWLRQQWIETCAQPPLA